MFLGKPKRINLELMGAAGNMKNKIKSFTHCVRSKRLDKAHGSCSGMWRGVSQQQRQMGMSEAMPFWA